MRCERQVRESIVFLKFDIFRRDSLRVLEIGVLRHPVIPLLVQQVRQVQQVRRACAAIEPDNAEQFVLPAELAPVAQRTPR